MEQQYQFNPDAPKPKKKKRRISGRNSGFLYIWGPLLLKWVISFVVSAIGIFVFECYVLVRESGVNFKTADAMEQFRQFLMQVYVNNTDNTNALIVRLSEEFAKYTTPIEGFAAFITIPILVYFYRNDNIRNKMIGVVSNKKAPVWMYSAIVVLALALSLGFNNLFIISKLNVSDTTYTETMKVLYSTAFPIQLLCLGVLIPISEELVFRALMFKRMREKSTFLIAALYSSVAFGFFHANMVQMIYGFCLGMVFCYLTEKYGSVWAPIVAHVTVNVFGVVLTQYSWLDKLAKNDLRLGVVTVLCATVSATMYVLIKKIEEKPETIKAEESESL